MGIEDEWRGFVCSLLVGVCIFCPSSTGGSFADCKPLSPALLQRAERAARKFAPVIWLAPEETFFPSSTLDFLEHTKANLNTNGKFSLPTGPKSRNTFLEPKEPIATLLSNSSSFLHGHNPEFFSVPVYAVVSSCCSKLKASQVEESPFEITFWLFFPFSQGKDICTISAGAFGPMPFPWLRKACLGKVKRYGSHLGDWEHVTLSFPASGLRPLAMYVSTHEAGALYLAPMFQSERIWNFKGYEVRKGIKIGTPRFPKSAFNLDSGRPVLFAAKGSHGLWTLPGRHKYVSFPALEDETGFGTMWRTWQGLQIMAWPPKEDDPEWLKFEGHWGGEKQDCHPLSEKVCSQSDGPRGIPTKTHSFRCLAQGITLKSV
ncbi:uncharacterized protein LOC132205448 isoform X2 [Neocloeon triangulifer]|uniref:uncharacterized protein LOC132205448 isoform X2 n=1 Tax=Neocloeon triangulifer TaxID=2078957 RepID=UPI00286F35B4|nr:uncharacterized protein LOC132205448 isoform X2 [Neocloeon triangulifer]